MQRSLVILLVVLVAFPVSNAWAQLTLLSSLENDFDVVPGGSYTGTISLRNTTSEPRDIRIYQMDSRYEASGTKYTEAGTQPRSNANWISFAPASFSVAGNSDFTLTYTVSAPEADTLTGSYWSVLMVESVLAEPREANSSTRGGQVRLGVKFRYAVQVAAHVGDGEFVASMSNFEALLGEADEPAVQVDLRNDGDLMGQPLVWLELYDGRGELVGKFDGAERRMYPGAVFRQRISLGSIPPGEYKALLLVDAGSEELFGAQYTLKF